jgi:antitoxin component of MazEF toxin-antitoxin module
MKNVIKTKVTSWGNSYGLRLPKSFINEHEEYLADEMEVVLDKNSKGFIVRPATTAKSKEYFREQLKKMKGTKSEDMHELDWGKPVGNEIW